MSSQLDIYVGDIHAGRLYINNLRGKDSFVFEYAASWIERPDSFALEPHAPLGRGPLHPPVGRDTFGFLSDCSPDRWGRKLLIRAESHLAKAESRAAKTLLESDFLLRVRDTTRHGAVRLKDVESSEFLASEESQGVPPLVSLGKLLRAAQRLERHEEEDEDIRILTAPGASLGGARPKAVVAETNGELWIAKFPSKDDDWDVPLWEYVGLELAEKAGISTPLFRLKKVREKNVLLIKRFDRQEGMRIHFASAMTLLDAQDGEQRSYPELAEVLAEKGATPADDRKELWRRMVFNILISNVDDHLRNHGFLRKAGGFCLSPVFDLESTPPEYKSHHQTYITLDDGSSSTENALSVAEYFGLSAQQARVILSEVASATSRWAERAKAAGAKRTELEIMGSAFKHPDSKSAVNRPRHGRRRHNYRARQSGHGSFRPQP